MRNMVVFALLSAFAASMQFGETQTIWDVLWLGQIGSILVSYFVLRKQRQSSG